MFQFISGDLRWLRLRYFSTDRSRRWPSEDAGIVKRRNWIKGILSGSIETAVQSKTRSVRGED